LMTGREFRGRTWQRVAHVERIPGGDKKPNRGRECVTERAKRRFRNRFEDAGRER